MLVDTHCHLSKEDYENLDEVINNMDGLMISSGCDDKTNLEVLDIANKYNKVYGTLGIHPEEVDSITDNSFSIIEKNLLNPKIVAIGEIGLDYYWKNDNKELQKEIFKKQLDLAVKYNKPVVVHSRDSIQDVYDILKTYNLKGTIHCFNSSIEMAREFIKIGFNIGVGGVLTFKNSKKLQEVVKEIDINHLLLETDSPFLSPEPFRGKQNVPSNVYFVASKIAEIKEIKIEEVIEKTTKNALLEFDLNKQL